MTASKEQAFSQAENIQPMNREEFAGQESDEDHRVNFGRTDTFKA
jgi:hypothetical protein